MLCIDCVIQMTGTIKKKDVGANKQVLDKLKVERERGITGKPFTYHGCIVLLIPYAVKAQTARYKP